MALFVPLDASYDQDPKILDLDDERSELLFVRSLAYSKRHLLDGHIHRRALQQIAPFAGQVDPLDLADDLVRHGLWTATDKGWRITAWLKRNPPSESIKTASWGAQAAHQRHHVKKGVVKPGCPYCEPVDNEEPQVTTHDACGNAMPHAQHALPESVPEPEPVPPSSSLRTTSGEHPADPSHPDEAAAPAPDPDPTPAVDLEQQTRRTAVLVGRAIADTRPGTVNPTGYAAGVTRQILDPAGDGIDRTRIERLLADGQTPETIAAAWAAPTDPLAGVLDGPNTEPAAAPRPHPPAFTGHDQPPRDDALNATGIAAARAAIRGIA